MICRLTRGIGVSILSLIAATSMAAQENAAKRLSSIVGVAVEEYAKAVDEQGKLISKDEFEETYGFLTDARQVATRLNTYEAPTTRAILDSLIAAVAQRKPPAVLKDLHRRFAISLGTAGAVHLPQTPPHLAAGHPPFAEKLSS